MNSPGADAEWHKHRPADASAARMDQTRVLNCSGSSTVREWTAGGSKMMNVRKIIKHSSTLKWKIVQSGFDVRQIFHCLT